MKTTNTVPQTKEQIEQELRLLHDTQQDNFIDKLNEDVDWLIEKSMKSTYQPTEHERVIFNQIRQKLENMNKWF